MADHTVSIGQDTAGDWTVDPYVLGHVHASQTIEWTTTSAHTIEVKFAEPVVDPKNIKLIKTAKVSKNPVKKTYLYEVWVDGKQTPVKPALRSKAPGAAEPLSAPGIIIE